MQTFRRYLPWGLMTLGILYVLSTMRPAPATTNGFRLSAFGALPILDHGRIKPIDTYARMTLLNVNRRQDYRDIKKETQPAIQWFANLMAEGVIDRMATIMIAPGVQKWLDLEPSRDGLHGVGEVIRAVRAKKPEFDALIQKKARDPLEEQVALVAAQAAKQYEIARDMREKLGKNNDPDAQRVFRIDYDQLLEMLKLTRREGLRYSVEEITHSADPDNRQAFLDFFRKAMQLQNISPEKRDITDVRVLDLYRSLSVHRALSTLQGVALVPDKEFSAQGWKTLGQAIQSGDTADNPHARLLEGMALAYTRGDATAFNNDLTAYQALAEAAMPRETSMARLEAWFNQFAPFYRAAILYLFIFLLAIMSWLFWSRELSLSAVLLLAVTLTLHTAALILRMYIQGRPPVTNLYSSAIFIGWGCSVVCLIMEMINLTKPANTRNSIPSAVAGLLGFGTMLIAHFLGTSGDTMEVLQAVLDTNFWLATHVTTVTLGYTATFVAGFIAIVFLWWMLATTLFAFFQNRGKAEWSNLPVFIAAANGVALIPGTLLVAILWGTYYIVFEEDPFADGVAAILMMPVLVSLGIYAMMLIARYNSPDVSAQERVPDMLGWATGMKLDLSTSKAFMNAIYGVTCLALLLSFVGTVLGGIWADQSWGRFWGWDPKENGAILVVIINALLLHARWGGMIKERGTVILALLGNMVTMWSWFGTNQLGIGLHSYGFNNGLIAMCTSFWVSQLVLIGLASLPTQYWKSYTALEAEPTKEAENKPVLKQKGAIKAPAK